LLQVKESIEMKRDQIKHEARLKQQKTEARIKATQSFFQQQADEAKALFDLKMKENEKKRQDFEKRREEEIAQRKERAEKKALELLEVRRLLLLLLSPLLVDTCIVQVQKRLEDAEMQRVGELNAKEQVSATLRAAAAGLVMQRVAGDAAADGGKGARAPCG
jgi:hypothetical protein